MSREIPTHELPIVLEGRLRSLRRRIRAFRLAQGAVVTLTVLLAVMMLAMWIDWQVVLFAVKGRTAITLISLAIVAVVFVWKCLWPLLKPLRFSSVAQQVDQSVPSMQERWSTVTELAESDDPDEIRGAPRLVQQVADEAVAREHLVVPESVISRRHLLPFAYGLACVLAVWLVMLLAAPTATKVLAARFWAPTADISMTKIVSRTGDRFAARKEPLIVEADIEGIDRSTATLFIRESDGERAIPLARTGGKGGAFQHKIRSLEKSFEYRFRAGDGQTRWYRIEAVDRPEIAEVALKIVPPAYSKLPTNERKELPRRCRALEGSRLELAFRATKPLARMDLRFDKEHSEPLADAGENWYRYESVLSKSLFFRPQLVDAHGLTNRSSPSCRIAVYPDKPPSVEIVSPDEEVVVRPDDTIAIEFVAKDDFGVSEADLLVTTDRGEQGKEQKVIPIPLGQQQGAKQLKKKVELDLKAFGVEHGMAMSYAVRVKDSRHAEAVGEIAGPASDPPPSEASEPSEASDKLASADTGQQPTDPQETESAAAAPSTQPASAQSDKPGDCGPKEAGQSDTEQADKGKDEKGDDSSSPPPNAMTLRKLDTGENATESKPQRIQVDKYAGSFEGQARKKLQIEIDKYLKRLKAALVVAEVLTNELLTHTKVSQEWGGHQGNTLKQDRKKVADAQGTIRELRGISADTPYAFIGLQLEDIGQAHVSPAGQRLSQVGVPDVPQADRTRALAEASYHIARALDKLTDLTRKYEAVKQEHNLADMLARFETMHQVFVEDMYAFLQSKKPKLNPRDSKKQVEVDEAFADAVKEYYEELKKVMEELSKILAEDPELLRRYMAMMRLEGTTIRDQLTLLANRQKAIQAQLTQCIAVGRANRETLTLQSTLLALHQADLRELAQLTARLYENVMTWLPRDIDRTQKPLPELIETAEQAARTAYLATRMTASTTPAGESTLVDRVREQMGQFHELLGQVHADRTEDRKLTIFVANRMAEAEKITAVQSAWLKKRKALQEGKLGRALAVDQDRLRIDTAEFGVKLDRVRAMLESAPEEVRDKADELEEKVTVDVVDHQTEASIALKTDRLMKGSNSSLATVESFIEAERLFDELLTLLEEGMDPGAPMAPTPPTLEKLLAMLEEEAKACEKLGLAPIRMNLMIQGDWMMPGEGAGAGMGSGQGTGSGKGQEGKQAGGKGDDQRNPSKEMAERGLAGQAYGAHAHMEEAAKEFGKLREQAEADASRMSRAKNEAGNVGDGGAPTVDGSDNVPDVDRADERDFNVLASELEEELSQYPDQTGPEEYREAIDSYFRTLSKELSTESAR